MADRSVLVILRAAVSQYVAGMTQAALATKKVGDETEKSSDKSRGMGDTAKLLPPLMMKVGAAAGAAAILAVKKFADFDAAMSSVQAATHETAGNMDALRAAAVRAGNDTAFSATEAAGAIEALAKAGVSTSDILGGGLGGALDLAAAGTIEVADAAEIAATAMTQFNLAGSDVPHIADLLAAGAGKAQGEVTDMAMALKQSGLVASQMGLSIEETTGSLTAFASAGLLGSDAGTSLRTMLLRLASPSKESADTMRSLGVAAYDAQGNFVGMASLAGQLQTALAPLPQAQRDAALATIFGSDAIRAANVLYQQGEQGIRDWTSAVDDQGYAAETAATKMDNLKGDLERLMGTIESFAIDASDESGGFLRSLVQFADETISRLDSATDSLGGLEERVDTFWAKVIPGYDSFLEKQQAADAAERDSITTRQQGTAALAENMAASWAAREAIYGYAAGSAEAEVTTRAAAAATEEQNKQLAEARDQYFKTQSAILGLSDANIAYESAVDNATDALRDNGTNLDINTQKGRENRTALDQIAGSALRVMQQMYDTGASETEVSARTDAMRGALFNAARQFGMTEDQAAAYVDQVLRTPERVDTTVTLSGVQAAASAAAQLAAAYRGVPTYINTVFDRTIITRNTTIGDLSSTGGRKDGGLVGGFASGGMAHFPFGGRVFGPGGPRDDMVPAWLSNGEFVVNAAATRRTLPLLEAINSGRAVNPSVANVGGPTTQITYGNVSVVDVDELMRRQRDAQADAAAMAGLAGIAAGV